MNLDGTERQLLAGGADSFGFVHDIAVDPIGEFVYWGVAGIQNDAIHRVRIDGTGLETVMHDGLSYTAGLALDQVHSADYVPHVLANDRDADGDALIATLVEGPNHGTLELAADGSFAYRPDAGFAGEDRFVYEALDPSGAVSNHTAVTITVLPPGDFNGDRRIDAIDIDMLMGIIRDDDAAGVAAAPLASEMSMYDLTGDRVVNRSDADYLIETVLETAYGDLDLDGFVGLRDVELVQSGLQRSSSGWASGDTTGDGVVDRNDVARVTRNLGFGREQSQLQASPSAAVPQIATDTPLRARLTPRGVDAVLAVEQFRRDRNTGERAHDRSEARGNASASGVQTLLRARRATRREAPSAHRDLPTLE